MIRIRDWENTPGGGYERRIAGIKMEVNRTMATCPRPDERWSAGIHAPDWTYLGSFGDARDACYACEAAAAKIIREELDTLESQIAEY